RSSARTTRPRRASSTSPSATAPPSTWPTSPSSTASPPPSAASTPTQAAHSPPPHRCGGGVSAAGPRPAFGGQGLYRALVAARAREAARLGAQYLIVDALPTSRPILQRLGFTHV